MWCTVLYCTQTFRRWFVQHGYWCFNAVPTNPLSSGVTHSIGGKNYCLPQGIPVTRSGMGPYEPSVDHKRRKGTMSVDTGLCPREVVGRRGLLRISLQSSGKIHKVCCRLDSRTAPGHVYATLCGSHKPLSRPRREWETQLILSAARCTIYDKSRIILVSYYS